MGRVTLTIALPALAYIRGPSPSPIHEESTLFPTGLRSPILSPLLPFFPYSSRGVPWVRWPLLRPVSLDEHYAWFQVQLKSILSECASSINRNGIPGFVTDLVKQLLSLMIQYLCPLISSSHWRINDDESIENHRVTLFHRMLDTVIFLSNNYLTTVSACKLYGLRSSLVSRVICTIIRDRKFHTILRYDILLWSLWLF